MLGEIPQEELSPEEKKSRREQKMAVRLVVLVVFVLLVVMFAFAVSQGRKTVSSAPAAQAVQPDSSLAQMVQQTQDGLVAPAQDVAGVTVATSGVYFYFATDKADLADGAKAALTAMAADAKRNQFVVISSYYAKVAGAPAASSAVAQELAIRRSSQVRDLLLTLGVAENQIYVLKPVEAKGEDAAIELRRVDAVTIAQVDDLQPNMLLYPRASRSAGQAVSSLSTVGDSEQRRGTPSKQPAQAAGQ